MKNLPHQQSYINNHQNLIKALRGEDFIYHTPPNINADLDPTDHAELLEKIIYQIPSVEALPIVKIELENSLKEICYDALGVFCAIQCFYMQILLEEEKKSPFKIDKNCLAKFLMEKFIVNSTELKILKLSSADIEINKNYRLTLSRINILSRDYNINWGYPIPQHIINII